MEEHQERNVHYTNKFDNETDIPQEENDKKSNKIRNWIAIILIVAILLYIIKVPYEDYSIRNSEVEHKTTIKNREIVRNLDSDCGLDFYRYAYNWDGWNSQDLILSPRFFVQNLEDEPGQFNITFAFFEESKYPFSEYETKVPWDDVAFWSKTQPVNLDAGQILLVSIPTQKPDPRKEYWASADIGLPDIYRCYDTVNYTEEIVNKDVTVMCPTQEVITTTNKISIWEWFFR